MRRKGQFPEARKIHLIDIENAVGAAIPSASMITKFRRVYDRLGIVGAGDIVIVACNHLAAVEVVTAWPDVPRLLLRSGPNIADNALLDVLRNEHIERRFRELVICSGDGIFTESVTQMASHGLKTTIVSRELSLSARLRLAASRVVLITPNTPESEALREAA